VLLLVLLLVLLVLLLAPPCPARKTSFLVRHQQASAWRPAGKSHRSYGSMY
jgi:hypothetical protein